jgi:hypothetical protein
MTSPTSPTKAVRQISRTGDHHLSDKGPLKGPCRSERCSVPGVRELWESKVVGVVSPDEQPKTRFSIVLQVHGHATEAETIRRLRAALKMLRRAFGLRVVSIVPEEPEHGQATA